MARLPGRAALSEWVDLRLFLGASEWSRHEDPRSANAGVSYPPLTRETFEQGVARYLAMHGKKA